MVAKACICLFIYLLGMYFASVEELVTQPSLNSTEEEMESREGGEPVPSPPLLEHKAAFLTRAACAGAGIAKVWTRQYIPDDASTMGQKAHTESAKGRLLSLH